MHVRLEALERRNSLTVRQKKVGENNSKLAAFQPIQSLGKAFDMGNFELSRSALAKERPQQPRIGSAVFDQK